MKHIRQVTKRTPVHAAAWQDFLCNLAALLAAWMSAKGGSIPLIAAIDEKCQPSTTIET